jgi:hypothetical protein
MSTHSHIYIYIHIHGENPSAVTAAESEYKKNASAATVAAAAVCYALFAVAAERRSYSMKGMMWIFSSIRAEYVTQRSTFVCSDVILK